MTAYRRRRNTKGGMGCRCHIRTEMEIRGPYRASPHERRSVPCPFAWYWYCKRCGLMGRRAGEEEIDLLYASVPDRDTWVDEVSSAFATPRVR